MKMLTMLQRWLAGERTGELPLQLPPPVAQLVGFEPVTIEDGSAVFRLDIRPDKHANPMGTVHGGVLCDIADAAMGMSCASLLELGESFTTVELKINFFRPVVEGVVEARGHVVNRGRTLVYLECDVVKVPEQKLVAKSTSTCLILRGDQARGR